MGDETQAAGDEASGGNAATSAAPDAIPCGLAIGGVDMPSADHSVILQSVALPVGVAERAVLQASPTVLPDGTAGFFAKDGLLVRTGARVTLTVPAAVRGQLWLGWGSVRPPAQQLTVDACDGRWEWLAYAGGYTVRSVGCYPVTVTVGSERVEVLIPIGADCPLPAPVT